MRWIVGGILVLAAVLTAVFWSDGERATRRPGEREAGSPVAPSAAKPEPVDPDAPLFRARLENEEGVPVPDAACTGTFFGREQRALDPLRSDAGGGVEARGRAGDASLRIEIRHPEYAFASVPVEAWLAEPAVIVLKRGAPLGVRVLKPDRTPAAGAVVEARINYEGGWDRNEKRTAGADGRAHFGTWGESDVHVEVEYDGFARAVSNFEVAGTEPVEHEIVLLGGGTITGKVFDPDGNGLDGARVFTLHRETTTKPDGTYRLDHVQPGGAYVRASKDGFGPGHFGKTAGWRRNVPVVLEDGELVSGVDITLGVATHVRGRIVDENGEPVAGVAVHVNVSDGMTLNNAGKTKEDGVFHIGPWSLRKKGRVSAYFNAPFHRVKRIEPREVAPGEDLDLGDIVATSYATVRGVVRAPDGTQLPRGVSPYVMGGRGARADRDGRFELRAPAGKVRLRATARLRDGALLQSQPVELEVKDGETREGVELPLVRLHPIRGRVVDPSGAPVRGVRLAAVPPDAEGPFALSDGPWAVTDAKGDYVLHVPSGDELLVGLQDGSARKFTLRRDPPPRLARGGDTGIDLVYAPARRGAVIQGRVVAKRDGRPIEDLSVTFIRHVFFIPQHFYFMSFEDPEGRFENELEEPGTYAVSVSADGYASFKTKTFSVKAGETKDVGTLRLGDGGTLRGVVKDAAGRPVPYAEVHLLSAKLQSRSGAHTDQHGRFRHDGVSPGVYTVFAVSPRHPLLIRRNVPVEESKTKRLTLTFGEPAPLTVVVLDENGQPVEGAELVYTFAALKPFTSRDVSGYEPPGYGSNRADAAGIIRKPSAPPGTFHITVEAKGFFLAKRDIELKGGEERRIEVRLKRK